MKEVYCQEVIISNLKKRGDNTSELDPVRNITQVFDKEGNFIAEHDPASHAVPYWVAIEFAQRCIGRGITRTSINEEAFLEFLKETGRL